MTVVELISKEECHLCDVARDTILRVQHDIPFELRQIKISEGEPLFEQYGHRVPVILINNEFAFQFKVRENDLAAKLRALER